MRNPANALGPNTPERSNTPPHKERKGLSKAQKQQQRELNPEETTKSYNHPPDCVRMCPSRSDLNKFIGLVAMEVTKPITS